MLDGAIVIPLQSMFWNLLFELAALLWMIDRALLNVGYFILTLTGWLTQHVFAPLLSVVGQQTEQFIGPLFFIALTILGFTYLLAVFGRFQVVDFRAAVMWLLFAATLYTFGPTFYTGLEDFRRLLGGGFYEASIMAFNDAGSATGLSAIGSMPADSITTPTDQFGQFLPGVPGANAIDGLDVAMAYIGADGFDVLAAAGSPHPIARLPWSMVAAGGGSYFDPEIGPAAFFDMSDAERQASLGRAVQGVWRAFTTIFIAIFGIIEQLVNFIMAASFAVAFFSMFIAVLFGFFIRTEPIAWGALNLIIELFIHSVINSVLMSIILGFVLVGANTANAILLLGASLVGLWMSWNLLQSALKGLVNSSERLYQGFAASTGGNMVTVSETNKSVAEASLSAFSGASVMAGGGSFLQAMGATFGDNRSAQTMNYASRMLGGEATLLGGAANALGEGAAAKSLAGPLGGYLLGRQTQEQASEQQERAERRDYVGSADINRSAAVQSYRQTGQTRALELAFAPEQQPQVQALEANYETDDFDSIVDVVRRVRNEHPALAPTNPQFLGHVRDELPDHLRHIETPALEAFATAFGTTADPSPHLTAVDAFSPDDAERVAQLVDSHDDDDFAALIHAVQVADTPQPQAIRTQLPRHLQATASADLQALARTIAPPNLYLGDADHNRDTVVAAYREGDESADILQQTFDPQLAQDVQHLIDNYQQQNFDAIVRAVRQARTDDPDRNPTGASALRATRRQLPPALQQMPTADLNTFAQAFGGTADIPAIGNAAGIARPRRRDIAADPPPPPIIPLPLQEIRTMSAAQRIRLENHGITQTAELSAAPAQQVANIARVEPAQAQQWQQEAIRQSLQTYTRQLEAGADV